jgi:hypothetical protein
MQEGTANELSVRWTVRLGRGTYELCTRVTFLTLIPC